VVEPPGFAILHFKKACEAIVTILLAGPSAQTSLQGANLKFGNLSQLCRQPKWRTHCEKRLAAVESEGDRMFWGGRKGLTDDCRL
jgi:hypothetical protein